MIFSITATSQFESLRKVNPELLFEIRNLLQSWKQNLLRHAFSNYPDILATTIQQRSSIIIATDGAKSSHQSGGGWTASSCTCKILVHGANPALGSQSNMHSRTNQRHTLRYLLSSFCQINQSTLTLNY